MPGRAPKQAVSENPAGRVDILMLRLGELVTRPLERALSEAIGRPVNLWDGEGGVQPTIQRFCDEQGLTGFRLTPEKVAESAGLVRGKKKFSRRVGAAK